MSDDEPDDFERQLRQARPAKPPQDFTARLLAAKPKVKTVAETAPQLPSTTDFFRSFWLWLRWLIPATALAVAALVAWHDGEPFTEHPSRSKSSSRIGGDTAAPLLKVDEVKIDQRLVSSFDTVARLSTGEPMRFHCENWMDQVVVSDKSHGLVVENSRPRFEVMPVGFETY